MRKVFSIFALLLLTNSSFASSSDYPKPKLEKEMEEMGSLLKGEGIVFRPGKEKSTATKAKVGNINKYLYESSIDTLKAFPIISADSKVGVIITDWYSPKGYSDTQFKLTVYIKDEVITPEALDVVAFQRKKINGKWSNDPQPSNISSEIEGKIIRKARDLYLKSSK